MIHKTYISKMNTIINGSELNTSLNPVASLIYGRNITRVLLYFDHTDIKRMMEDGTFPDKGKISHVLKITNAGSLDFTQLHCGEISSIDDSLKRRASSFDIIFFLIPKEWDAGKGFDYSNNFLNKDFYDTCQKDRNRLISTDGCNWYQARNGINWDEPGIYSNDKLSKEYDNFATVDGSPIIIGRQRFEIGGENINIDITEIVNKFVSGELENHGIGFAFTPALERLGEDETKSVSKVENYVGFFTNKTNLFFEPFLETIYDDYIDDDRSNFVLNKKNRLYLYVNIGGRPEDLDETPTCTIKNDSYEIILDNLEVVKQFRGVYYVDVMFSSREVEPDIMFYDVWSNIKYDGVDLDDVELDFVTKRPSLYFNIDNTMHDEPDYTPLIAGINANEEIFRVDEVRKITVTAKPSFTQNVGVLLDEMYYRLYTMDGEREITVIPYEHVNMTFNENFFYLNCDMLIPQKYYLDIRFKYNGETKTFKDVLHFKIVNNLDNKYA